MISSTNPLGLCEGDCDEDDECAVRTFIILALLTIPIASCVHKSCISANIMYDRRAYTATTVTYRALMLMRKFPAVMESR